MDANTPTYHSICSGIASVTRRNTAGEDCITAGPLKVDPLVTGRLYWPPLAKAAPKQASLAMVRIGNSPLAQKENQPGHVNTVAEIIFRIGGPVEEQQALEMILRMHEKTRATSRRNLGGLWTKRGAMSSHKAHKHQESQPARRYTIPATCMFCSAAYRDRPRAIAHLASSEGCDAQPHHR